MERTGRRDASRKGFELGRERRKMNGRLAKEWGGWFSDSRTVYGAPYTERNTTRPPRRSGSTRVKDSRASGRGARGVIHSAVITYRYGRSRLVVRLMCLVEARRNYTERGQGSDRAEPENRTRFVRLRGATYNSRGSASCGRAAGELPDATTPSKFRFFIFYFYGNEK